MPIRGNRESSFRDDSQLAVEKNSFAFVGISQSEHSDRIRCHHRIAARMLAATMAILAIAALFLKIDDARAGVEDLTVSDYQFVTRRRAGRTFYDYTYTISVSNSGESLENVVATATSLTGNTTVLSGVVPIGTIAAGTSVQSTEFFVFRQNRRVSFNPEDIVWTFTADPAGPTNTAPVADAGPDQSVESGATVTLNGSASTDSDGDPITYAWELQARPPGSTAVLDDSTAITPSFIADVPGDYFAQLVVNDGSVTSLPDTVQISTLNAPPVADAGLDQTVPVGATVIVFGGASSDANGHSLTYAWELLSAPEGSSAALTTLVDVQTTFVIDMPGQYVVQLVVNDGFDDSLPDTATITTQNSPPVADAGLDQSVDVGETVNLDGSFSFDVDGDPLTYLWSLISAPEGSIASLSNVVSVTTQFIADLEGIYVAQLTVNDGTVDSTPDTAMVTATVGNQAPVAVAESSSTNVIPGALVQLDGSNSTDADDDPLSYAWTLIVPPGSNASLSASNAVSPSFTADIEGIYQASLVVNDGNLDSAPSVVAVTATADNNPPTLAAIGNRVMFLGDSLNFRLFGIDPDIGDTLTYSLPQLPTNMGVNGATGDVSFTPDGSQLGVNAVIAQVEDNSGLSDTQNFTVEVRQAIAPVPDNAPPTLAPITDRSITAGSTLNVQADADDPDAGDVLTFSLPLAPPNMTISSAGAIQWTAQTSQIGLHDVTVQVADELGAVALQSFIVTVVSVNRAPQAVDEVYDARIGETTTITAPGVLGNDSDPDNDPLAAVLVSTTTSGVLDFRPDGSFDYTPGLVEEFGPVELELQCENELLADGPFQTNGTVTAGDVDNDGDVEIVGTSFNSSNLRTELWIMNATDCTIELGASPDVVAAGGFTDGPQLGLLDIDGDGDLEIIGSRIRLPDAEGGFQDGQHLLAVHHDGTLAWPGNGASQDIAFLPEITAGSSIGDFRYTGPTFADLDADGSIEIVMPWRSSAGFGVTQNGLTAFNAEDGTVQWSYQGETTTGVNVSRPPVVADLDTDGTMEVIFDNEVVSHTGLREFLLPVESPGSSFLFTAVANFDADPEAEIVARDQENHYLYNHDGSLIWQREQPNTSRSQIAVADFDNDGELEFAYNTSFGNASAATPGFMVVWDTDGQTLLWSHESDTALQLASTSRLRGPNATAFDANEDGFADLVIHYDMGAVPESGVYIFDGRDGSVMEFADIFAAGNAGDVQRYVTIVDVDDDGEAEVISSFNGGAGRTRIWQGTTENPLPAAPQMRDQWVFNAAHLDDRRQEIITDPTPHWLQARLNGFNMVSSPDRVYVQLQCEVTTGLHQSNATIAVGDIDNDGDTEMLGVNNVGPGLPSALWILNSDCTPQTVTDSQALADAGGLTVGSHLGLLDIDGDDDLEIIGVRQGFPGGGSDGDHLLAVHHDGSLAWTGDGASETITLDDMIGNSSGGGFNQIGPTFADIDANGSVEIVMPWYTGAGIGGGVIQGGLTVFNSVDGTILWEYLAGELQFGDSDYKPPLVVDLDLDGTMEIVYHTNVVDHTGNLEFVLPTQVNSAGRSTHLATAVANFDDDPFAEIIAIDTTNHYLFNHDGSLVFQNPVQNNSQSQITVADFDGDNEVEYAWYNGLGSTLTLGFYEVYETDGTLLWSHRGLREYGEELSRFKGVNGTAFDANNDGAFDIVVHLNVFDNLQEDDGVYIFDGRDGSVLEFMPIGSNSFEQRFTTIADVDSDGEAEIISSRTNGLQLQTRIWEGEESHALPVAPTYRNQWVFNEAYADASGDTLSNQTPHWLQPGLNGYNLIKRPPNPLAGTVDSFTYVASDGQLNSNTATVSFDVQPPGLAPVFLTNPDTLTTVGFPYQYAPRVVDPDPGDSVSFTLVAAPPGMTMSSTGRLNWMPESEGEFAVSIVASDTIGFATPQSFTLVVGQPVVVPDLIGQPQAIAEGNLAGANLLTGTVRTENHPSVAAGSVFDQTPIAGAVAEFGASVDLSISIGPGPADIDDDGDGFTENQGDCSDDDDTIGPGSADPAGDGIDQDCDGIDGNLELTEILVMPGTTTVLAGQSVTLTATGIFADGTSQNLTGVVGWTNGPAFSSATAGSFTVTASRDGITGNATVNVVDRAAGDQLPPVVEITAPVNNGTITEPVDVTGTASDTNFLKYELAYAVPGETNFTNIATSTAPVNDGVLGQFDPTLLINDLYTIRLTVFDTGGNQSIAETIVQVDGNMKIGNFTLSYTDLQIPLSGIPILVTRTYDSRDKNVGDFGVGWNLDINTLRINRNRVLGTGWQVVRSGLAFGLLATSEHKVSIALPGGRVEEFDLVISPAVSPITPFPPSAISANFTPRPGTRGALKSLDGNILTILEPQPGPVTLASDIDLSTYDPVRYLYTSPEGVEIVINRNTGVEEIRDRNGNIISIDNNGIRHSNGTTVDFDRDELGRIQSITDPNGTTQSYTYDANGDLTRHIDEAGFDTLLRYTLDHYLVDIVDPAGRNFVRNVYGDDNRLISSADAEGNLISFEHDISARIETVTDRRGGVRLVSYDERGNVISETDQAGETWRFTYDEFDRELTRTNPLNETVTVTYSEADEVLSVTNALGATHSFIRDSAGRILEERDATDRTISFDYDSRGNRVSETDSDGNTTRFSYDNSGNLVSIVDRSGDLDTLSYNARGQVIGTTLARGQQTELDVNNLGAVTEERHLAGTESGIRTVALGFEYDARGLLEQFDSPLVTERMTINWSDAGELESSIDPVGNAVSFQRDLTGKIVQTDWTSTPPLTLQYDQEGQEIGAVLPNGITVARVLDERGLETEITIGNTGTTRVERDELGRITLREEPGLGARQTEYDAVGRVSRKVFSDGTAISRTYDAAGRVTSITDTLNNTTALQYDSRGLLSLVEAPDGRTYERNYNEDGLIIARRDELGTLWQYEYVPGDLISAAIDPLGRQTEYTHGPNGEITSITTAAGEEFTYVYDDGGRLLQSGHPDGSSANCSFDALARPLICTDHNGRDINYSYDDIALSHSVTRFDGSETGFVNGAGYLTAVNINGDVYDLERDELGRLTSHRSPVGSQVDTVFAANGQRATTTTQSNISQNFDYDQRGFLEQLRDVSGNTTFDRDAGGRPLQINFENGAVLTRTYDEVGRATRIAYRTAGGTEAVSIDYTHDALGRIETATESGGRVTSYDYDLAGQLVGEVATGSASGSLAYAYDPNGNLVERIENGDVETFTIGTADKLLADAEANYSWDANGNLLSRSSGLAAEIFSYDSQDRLVIYQRTGANETTVEYTYAHDGLLETRTIDGEASFFTWDRNGPLPILLEIAGSDGVLESRYLYDGLFPIAEVDNNGTVLHHVRDRVGTLRRRIAADGSVAEILTFDAFGRQLSGAPSPVGYTAGFHDEATGFVFLRSRWYAPDIARFVTRDDAAVSPMDPRTVNRYTYAFNDPVNRFDPTGQVTVAEVVVNLAIANAIAIVGYAGAVDGVEALTSALGLFDIPFYFGEKINARFMSLGELTNVPGTANLPAVGNVSVGVGPFGVSFGFEAVHFNNPAVNALYITAGSSFGGNISAGVAATGKGNSTSFVPPSASAGSWISHTPTPSDYQGPFITAQAAAALPEIKLSGGGVAGKAANLLLGRLRGAGGQFFWSPTVTFRDRRGTPFRSHGVSSGLRNGAVGVKVSIGFTWYGLSREWER